MQAPRDLLWPMFDAAIAAACRPAKVVTLLISDVPGDRTNWDNAGAEKLDFRPRQNSEDFAAEILGQPNPLDPIAQQHQGGGFVTIDFTPMGQRRSRA